MPRYLALAAEWRVHPPAHWLLAAALKYRPADRDAKSPARQPTVAELKAAFPRGKL
ncbi:MAG: hypothetical protein WAU78_01750 [Roseiarcus sp.]